MNSNVHSNTNYPRFQFFHSRLFLLYFRNIFDIILIFNFIHFSWRFYYYSIDIIIYYKTLDLIHVPHRVPKNVRILFHHLKHLRDFLRKNTWQILATYLYDFVISHLILIATKLEIFICTLSIRFSTIDV